MKIGRVETAVGFEWVTPEGDTIRRLTGNPFSGEMAPGDLAGLRADSRLAPPVAPSKIVCVGRNYADHAKELNNPILSEPMLFMKPVTSLVDITEPRISIW